MSDQYGGEEPQPEPFAPVSVQERVRREVAVIFGRHGLVTRDGGMDLAAIAELIYPTIKEAVVETPGERTKIGVGAAQLMEKFFSDVPNSDKCAEIDDEEERAVQE